jgi:hypothetical protein
MVAIQNQLTGLSNLISISTAPFSTLSSNSKTACEITEHGRTYSGEILQSGSDVELARAVVKKYFKTNKRKFSFSFKYLPNTKDRTVDGRVGRDYLLQMSQHRGSVYLLIQLNPGDGYVEYPCYINSYNEKLVRRDLANQCAYYDVSIELEEQ